MKFEPRDKARTVTKVAVHCMRWLDLLRRRLGPQRARGVGRTMPRSGPRGPGSPNRRASRCTCSTPGEPMWPAPRRANHEPESSRGPMGPNRSAHPGARIPARTRNPLHIAFAPAEPGMCGVTCCTRCPASQQFLRRKNHVAARIVVRSKGPESAGGKWARIAARTM